MNGADRAVPDVGAQDVEAPDSGANGAPDTGARDVEAAAVEVTAAAVTARHGSRQRPSRTTGTFPPEGSAAAAGRGQPVPVRQWPIVVVLTMVGVGLAVTALGSFRPGVITIGAAMLLAGLLRLLLPEVGMLAVRSRFTDIVVMWVLGLAIVVLALASEPDPVISLPFVPEISHFFGGGQG
ncbi:DUF3017 domain-containing protein [Streptacidiphilus sp. EB129]|uniref:DUF3017 domain-containing protein n=1 Tax=Streptacidiphilus sp. EB129 TaxID=3156262 RepID=UPI003516D28D